MIHNQAVFTQGLRDWVVNVNAQTQAALASLHMSVQNISSEVHKLKDQLRPVLKKKTVRSDAGSYRHLLMVCLVSPLNYFTVYLRCVVGVCVCVCVCGCGCGCVCVCASGLRRRGVQRRMRSRTWV